MYILGGKLRGRRLASFKSSKIRPAMALVRKSIFSTISSFLPDSNVLDLCAGTGSVGIEAISRGASKLTFVDSNKYAINLIYKNLDLCNIKANVIYGKLPKVLDKIKSSNEKFNLVFLNPPYGQKEFIESVFESLISNKLLAKRGLIIIETEKNCDFPFPKVLKLYKFKKYGNTKVTFLLNSQKG